MRMNTTLVAGLVAGGVLGTIIAGAAAFGPLNPPSGPVAPTGETLDDIRSDIAGLAAALGGGSSSPAGLTTTIDDNALYFVEISGVSGEALEPYADGWTDLVEFGDLGVQRFIQGAGAGGIEVSQEVTLVMENGNALRSLLENVISLGTDIADINVRGYRDSPTAPGGVPPRVYTLEMDDVTVLSVQPDPAARASRVTVRARTYTWTYYNQLDSGAEDPLQPFVWNRGPLF